MMKIIFLSLTLPWSGAALAAEVIDSTGRTVQLPEKIAVVVPAGPPGVVVLSVIATVHP